MYLYIELWNAKDAWLKLTTSQRQEKINQLLKEAQLHPITGVIPFSFRKVGDVFLFDGVTEQPVVVSSEVARPTGFRYAAAWMIPTRELITKFEERVENLGWWFEYFDQENAWGVMDVMATVGDMVGGKIDPPDQKPTTLMGRFRQTERSVHRLAQDLHELRQDVRDIAEHVKQGAK